MKRRVSRGQADLLIFAACVLICVASPKRIAAGEAPALNLAILRYGNKESARCFSESFLLLLAKHSTCPVPSRLTPVDLSDPLLMAYPFAILSGEGPFELSDSERSNLRSYLSGGGFLLASAGCSSPAWDRSFREEFRFIFPEAVLEELPPDHPIFHFLFNCWPLRLKDGSVGVLKAARINGRIAVVYSASGLNDTSSLPDCCCCTGNEVVRGSQVIANAVLFAIAGAAR